MAAAPNTKRSKQATTRTCTRKSKRTHKRTRTHTKTRARASAYTHTHTFTHTHTHTHTRAQTHAHTHVRKHTHTHGHILKVYPKRPLSTCRVCLGYHQKHMLRVFMKCMHYGKGRERTAQQLIERCGPRVRIFTGHVRVEVDCRTKNVADLIMATARRVGPVITRCVVSTRRAVPFGRSRSPTRCAVGDPLVVRGARVDGVAPKHVHVVVRRQRGRKSGRRRAEIKHSVVASSRKNQSEVSAQMWIMDHTQLRAQYKRAPSTVDALVGISLEGSVRSWVFACTPWSACVSPCARARMPRNQQR